MLAGRVALDPAGHVRLVPLDQRERFDHGRVHRVGRPELQHLDDLDQPGPVVAGVGGLEDPLPVLPVGRALGLELAQQRHQRLVPAGHRRVDDVLHPLPGRLQGGLGHLEQDVLLARYPLQLRHEVAGHLGVRAGIDPVHGRDEQVGQGVGDLPLAAVQVGGQQRHHDLVRVGAQVTGRLGRDPGPPARQHLRRDIGEQVVREPDRADRAELERLLPDGLHADVARLVPDRREHVHPGHLSSTEQRAGLPGAGVLLIARVGRPRDQREHPGDSLSGDPAGDPRGQRLLSLPQRGADDPPDPVPGRRLDLLALQVRQQLLTDLAGLALLLAHVRGQPFRRLVSVRDRALPEPEVPPDIRPVSLDRPAVPLIQPQLIRGNVHQPRDVGDSLVRNLAAARREPAVHRIEPEQKSEPELRRATPPGQLLELITDQRPVPDQLIFIQHPRHETSGSLASTAATTHRKPNESGSMLAAHDQPRPGIRQGSSASPQGSLLTWDNAIACTW